MKRILLSGLALSLVLGATAASAQPGRYDDRRDDHRGQPSAGQGYDHHNWHRGGRVDRNEWRNGHRVDYRSRHLRKPPRGYEWREVNGDYVLGAVATGLIADLLLNNH
jgi:Ni/Co efflux regulator RcnB